MNLSLENLYDLREAVQKRLNEVATADVAIPEAKREQARRVNSLNEALDKIRDEIKDLEFEANQTTLSPL